MTLGEAQTEEGIQQIQSKSEGREKAPTLKAKQINPDRNSESMDYGNVDKTPRGNIKHPKQVNQNYVQYFTYIHIFITNALT